MAIVTNEQIAAKVRGAAAEHRTSQADIAAVLSISRMAMSRRFNGSTPFTGEDISRVASYLGVTIGSLFGEASHSTESAS